MFEKKMIRKYSRLESEFHPVFIIGPPRSGSTILYQVLSNHLNVLYIDNMVNLSRQNLYFGFWLSHKIFGDEPHNSFISKYGSTDKLHDPSESGRFWRRWIRKNEDFIGKGEISEKKVKEMRNILYAVINRYKKPLLIKNLYFSQRLNLLHEVAPKSKIIIIRRDPFFNAQSLLLAKRANVSENRMWSTRPPNYKELEKMDDAEQVVKQIFFIEKQIHEDIRHFPKEQIIEIGYESFMDNTTEIINKIREFIDPGLPLRKGSHIPDLVPSKEIRVHADDEKKIKEEIANMEWIRNMRPV